MSTTGTVKKRHVEWAREVYTVMEELTRFDNVCLGITSRISIVPPHCKRLTIQTLSTESAYDIFYAIYDNGGWSDIISHLVRRLDFHALSITLLTTVASHSMWDWQRSGRPNGRRCFEQFTTRAWQRRWSSRSLPRRSYRLGVPLARVVLYLKAPTLLLLSQDSFLHHPLVSPERLASLLCPQCPSWSSALPPSPRFQRSSLLLSMLPSPLPPFLSTLSSLGLIPPHLPSSPSTVVHHSHFPRHYPLIFSCPSSVPTHLP